MKILLLGSNGMLGQSIKKEALESNIEIIGVDRTDADYTFDLTNDIRLEQTIADVRPDVVVNTAAMISLEQCEGNSGLAYNVNARLPGVIANICKKYDCYQVQVSTDHYYVNDKKRKHKETDDINLVNEYARTKFLGEELTLLYKNSLVLRTNIVGFRGRGQLTFLEWVIKEIQSCQKMTLYTDFYTSSICVSDFARYLIMLLPKHPTGIYNLSSSEVTNKKEFILSVSKELFGIEPLYVDGSVKELEGARRAESLGLDNTKLESLLGCKMPNLKETIESIKKEYTRRKEVEI